MKKLIRWFKRVNRNAHIRGRLILKARETMSNMDAPWRAANTSNDEVALLLMKIGLAYLNGVYQGQMEAQNLVRARKAPLN